MIIAMSSDCSCRAFRRFVEVTWKPPRPEHWFISRLKATAFRARADDQGRNSLGVAEARFRLPGAWFSNKVGLMKYSDILTIEPGKRGGKPCIRGLRITVYDVLEYLASGMTHAEVLHEFPYLTDEDIRACLAYAADRERKLEISNA